MEHKMRWLLLVASSFAGVLAMFLLFGPSEKPVPMATEEELMSMTISGPKSDSPRIDVSELESCLEKCHGGIIRVPRERGEGFDRQFFLTTTTIHELVDRGWTPIGNFMVRRDGVFVEWKKTDSARYGDEFDLEDFKRDMARVLEVGKHEEVRMTSKAK